jgi:hypothetical protein
MEAAWVPLPSIIPPQQQKKGKLVPVQQAMKIYGAVEV